MSDSTNAAFSELTKLEYAAIKIYAAKIGTVYDVTSQEQQQIVQDSIAEAGRLLAVLDVHARHNK